MFGTMVEETEHGQTIAALRESDPHFEVEHFLKDAREFMIPEVMEAFIEWQPAELKQWCSEGVFNVLEMSREQATQDGHVIEGRLLDLRNVELAMARMMEDIPLLILSFKTQQTEVVRDRVGEIVMGSPVRRAVCAAQCANRPSLILFAHLTYMQDTINNVVYVWALTKDAEKPNPLTKGWRIVEFAIQDVRESL